jgi:hypothetical protein
MRRPAIVTSALLMLVVACGQQADQTTPGSGSGPATLSVAPSAGAVPATQLDASALPEGFPQEVWVQGDGKTLAVRTQEGGCGKASVEVAEQTDGQVVLTIVETQPTDAPVCTMDIRYPIITVTLDRPVDDRTIVLRSEQRTE